MYTGHEQVSESLHNREHAIEPGRIHLRFLSFAGLAGPAYNRGKGIDGGTLTLSAHHTKRQIQIVAIVLDFSKLSTSIARSSIMAQ